MHSAIQPLVNINLAVRQNDLKTCHAFIIKDLDEKTFLSEYKLAAESLRDIDCDTPKTYLLALEELELELNTIKIALARVIATKPHSADVER